MASVNRDGQQGLMGGLTEAKQMLDEGLISEPDYLEFKSSVLGSIRVIGGVKDQKNLLDAGLIDDQEYTKEKSSILKKVRNLEGMNEFKSMHEIGLISDEDYKELLSVVKRGSPAKENEVEEMLDQIQQTPKGGGGFNVDDFLGGSSFGGVDLDFDEF